MNYGISTPEVIRAAWWMAVRICRMDCDARTFDVQRDEINERRQLDRPLERCPDRRRTRVRQPGGGGGLDSGLVDAVEQRADADL